MAPGSCCTSLDYSSAPEMEALPLPSCSWPCRGLPQPAWFSSTDSCLAHPSSRPTKAEEGLLLVTLPRDRWNLRVTAVRTDGLLGLRGPRHPMAPSRLSCLTLSEPNTRHEQLLGHDATVGHSGLFVLFPWGMRDLQGENQESAGLKRGNWGRKGSRS